MSQASPPFNTPKAAEGGAIAAPFSEAAPKRKHHPFLDPELPDEDVALVPRDLAPGGGLSWVLPRGEKGGRGEGFDERFDVDVDVVGERVGGGMGQVGEDLESVEEMGGDREWAEVRALKISGNAACDAIHRDSFVQAEDASDDHDYRPELTSSGNSDRTTFLPRLNYDYDYRAESAYASDNGNESSQASDPSDRSHTTVQTPHIKQDLTMMEGISTYIRIVEWADAIVPPDHCLARSADQQRQEDHQEQQEDRSEEASFMATNNGIVPDGGGIAKRQSIDKEDGLKESIIETMSEGDCPYCRSLGQYNCFGPRTDMFGQGGNKPLPELKRRAGSVQLRTEKRSED